MVDEIVIGFEDAHELPDVFHRAELGAFRRQGDDGDVGRNDKPRRNVPAGLSGQEHGVSASRDGRGRLRRDARSSPRCCRRPGSGLRTCPARGRRHRRCRSRRCADRAERWGEIRAWLPLLHFAESGRQLSAVNLTAPIRACTLASPPSRAPWEAYALGVAKLALNRAGGSASDPVPEAGRRNAGGALDRGLIATAIAPPSRSFRRGRRRFEIRVPGTYPASRYFPVAPGPRCI
jgi:hypothetical protein